MGLLLEQMFPEAIIQMITTLIKPSGSQRAGEFSRVEEYIYFVMFGTAGPSSHHSDMLRDTKGDGAPSTNVTWHGLRRRGSTDWRRAHRPNMFYPLHIDEVSDELASIGEPLKPTDNRLEYAPPKGTYAVWPSCGSRANPRRAASPSSGASRETATR